MSVNINTKVVLFFSNHSIDGYEYKNYDGGEVMHFGVKVYTFFYIETYDTIVTTLELVNIFFETYRY